MNERLIHAAVLAGAFIAMSAVQAQPAAASSAPVSPAAGLDLSQCLPPLYPIDAARTNTQGTSTLVLTIGATDEVVDARIEGASGPTPEHAALDQAALTALRKCRIHNAGADGSPPPWTKRILYTWKLDNSPVSPEKSAEAQAQFSGRMAQLQAQARDGDPAAQLELAQQYAHGGVVEHDDRQASAWFRRAAEAGNADAQVYFGQRLLVGRGVERDDVAGVAWLRKAAAQGNGAAAYGLGLSARAGRGMRESDEQAFRWFLQGAGAGNVQAMLETAEAYTKGVGTSRDDAQAVRWYRAAAPGSVEAVYRLGLAYRDGRGVPADADRTAFCFAVAATLARRADADDALAAIASHLDAARLADIRARAAAWQPDQPLP